MPVGFGDLPIARPHAQLPLDLFQEGAPPYYNRLAPRRLANPPDPNDTTATTLFGSTDAEQTVLRVMV